MLFIRQDVFVHEIINIFNVKHCILISVSGFIVSVIVLMLLSSGAQSVLKFRLFSLLPTQTPM